MKILLSDLLDFFIDVFSNDDAELPLDEQIKNRLQKILNATITYGDRTQTMTYVFENEKHPHTVHVAIIAKDGNCLFSAIAHQLFGSKINSQKHIDETKQLRRDVVNYILENYSDSYEAGLIDGVLDEPNFPKEYDSSDAAHHFLSEYLPRNGVWGGQETLAAVQQMYNANIFIFRENDIITRMHLLCKVPDRTILLAQRRAAVLSNRHSYYL